MRGLFLQKYQRLHKQKAACTAIDKVNGYEKKETIQSPKCNSCLTKKPKEMQALFFRSFFILFIPLTAWHAADLIVALRCLFIYLHYANHLCWYFGSLSWLRRLTQTALKVCKADAAKAESCLLMCCGLEHSIVTCFFVSPTSLDKFTFTCLIMKRLLQKV